MNNEDEQRYNINLNKATVFLKNNITAHIEIKDRTFYNGKILQIDKENKCFWINDRKEGTKIISFLELKRTIVEFKEVRR